MKTCEVAKTVVMFCFRKTDQSSLCWALKACSHHAISTAHEQALNRHDQSGMLQQNCS
jgi:hypothetical protein